MAYTVRQLYKFALDAGFKGDAARQAAAVAMGESSGNPRAYNGKGADDSYGLMQINFKGKLWPYRKKKYGLTSKEDAYDPRVNFKIAYDIWDGRGGTFAKDWGAFGNKHYKAALKSLGTASPQDVPSADPIADIINANQAPPIPPRKPTGLDALAAPGYDKSGRPTTAQAAISDFTRTVPVAAPAPKQVPTTTFSYAPQPDLIQGAYNATVELQKRLNRFIKAAAPDMPPIAEDGILTPDTEGALAAFQKYNSIDPTGKANNVTLASLGEMYPSQGAEEPAPSTPTGKPYATRLGTGDGFAGTDPDTPYQDSGLEAPPGVGKAAIDAALRGDVEAFQAEVAKMSMIGTARTEMGDYYDYVGENFPHIASAASHSLTKNRNLLDGVGWPKENLLREAAADFDYNASNRLLGEKNAASMKATGLPPIPRLRPSLGAPASVLATRGVELQAPPPSDPFFSSGGDPGELQTFAPSYDQIFNPQRTESKGAHEITRRAPIRREFAQGPRYGPTVSERQKTNLSIGYNPASKSAGEYGSRPGPQPRHEMTPRERDLMVPDSDILSSMFGSSVGHSNRLGATAATPPPPIPPTSPVATSADTPNAGVAPQSHLDTPATGLEKLGLNGKKIGLFGGAALGGMLFGPIGALLGGWLGGKAGGKGLGGLGDFNLKNPLSGGLAGLGNMGNPAFAIDNFPTNRRGALLGSGRATAGRNIGGTVSGTTSTGGGFTSSSNDRDNPSSRDRTYKTKSGTYSSTNRRGTSNALRLR